MSVFPSLCSCASASNSVLVFILLSKIISDNSISKADRRFLFVGFDGSSSVALTELLVLSMLNLFSHGLCHVAWNSINSDDRHSVKPLHLHS